MPAVLGAVSLAALTLPAAAAAAAGAGPQAVRGPKVLATLKIGHTAQVAPISPRTGDVYAVGPFLSAHPAIVEDLLKANLRALDLIKSNPTKAEADADAEYASYTGKSIKASLVAASFKQIDFTADPDAASITTDAAQAVSLGLLKEPVSLEFTCLIGASGCGKSTMLSLVAGLDQPTTGNIAVSGRVAMMFQEPGLLPWLTAGANVELALRARGVGRAQRRQRTAELLDIVRLGGFGGKRPRELSGGMRQRVALARAGPGRGRAADGRAVQAVGTRVDHAPNVTKCARARTTSV